MLLKIKNVEVIVNMDEKRYIGRIVNPDPRLNILDSSLRKLEAAQLEITRLRQIIKQSETDLIRIRDNFSILGSSISQADNSRIKYDLDLLIEICLLKLKL